MRRIMSAAIAICLLIGFSAGAAAAPTTTLPPYKLCDKAKHKICVLLDYPPETKQAVVGSDKRAQYIVHGADELCHGNNVVTVSPPCPFNGHTTLNKQYKGGHLTWTGWYGDNNFGLISQPKHLAEAWSASTITGNGNEMVEASNGGLVDVYVSDQYYAIHHQSVGQYLCTDGKSGHRLYFGSFKAGTCQWTFTRVHLSSGSSTTSEAL